MADLLPVPSPFIVLVDDREKLPYTFEGLTADHDQGFRPLAVQTARAHLATGDYTIPGYEGRIAIERKGGADGLADLYGTIGQGRARFIRELERLALLEWSAVVVEAEWSEVLAGHRRSKLPPKIILRSVMAWQMRFPTTHWWWCAGREMGQVVTYRLLERWWKEQEAKKQKGEILP